MCQKVRMVKEKKRHDDDPMRGISDVWATRVLGQNIAAAGGDQPPRPGWLVTIRGDVSFVKCFSSLPLGR
jgi:hypothetical protein